MSPARTTRLRLTAAVAAVLAATTAGLTAPASAAPAAAPVAATAGQQGVPTVPVGTNVVSSGPTGFLTSRPDGNTRVYTWTRHADGTRTTLPGQRYGASIGTDVIVRIEGTTHTYIDMSTGTELVSFDTATLGGGGYSAARYMGSTLVASKEVNGVRAYHLFSKEQGLVVDREVTGIPAGAHALRADSSGPDTLVVHHSTLTNGVYDDGVSLVDVATGKAFETYGARDTDTRTVSALSATHLAWIEWPGGKPSLAVARRDSKAITRTPLGEGTDLSVKFVGDWVVHAQLGGGAASTPNPLYALTARSLNDPQRTVKLLDHAVNVTPTTDGGLLARGGTIEHGEGVYRVSRGEDGTPAATLIASTGETTVLGVKDHEAAPLPTAVDFARGDDARLFWEFDKAADYDVTMTHNASGRRWTDHHVHMDRPGLSGAEWTGMLDDRTSAPVGDYTWKLTAVPANGIGPGVERTGTLKVTAKPAPHDFTNSGTPDLLVKDSAGRIIDYDARQTLYETGHWGIPAQRTTVVLGTGWQIYDRVAAPGNLDASPHADVIARDRSGALWFYSGTGNALAPRKKIGTGWGVYTQLTGPGDLTGDGRADLVATDTTGALWLYSGTGNANAPFTARKKIGTGWGVYNRIAGTGNFAGGAAGDLVARDKDGVLWLYLGKGDGTFAPRIKVGRGWDRYSDLVGVGDVNRDGRPDLVVQGIAGGTNETLAFYEGTGDWRAPVSSRRGVYNPEDLGTGAVTLF
ncbi:VCBS repeat-containing protein [Streptomyces sp. NPDC096079]|uniref:FG-GAP repeat domain-containing protein n=1 Tax=Streptomyces sp. NPDC096079 TaxID=3155820 RepID=UPI0033185C43